MGRQQCLQQTAAGTEAKETGLELCPSGSKGEGAGGRKLPLSLNPWEEMMKRSMKTERRGK
jgi:hypothetical protein